MNRYNTVITLLRGLMRSMQLTILTHVMELWCGSVPALAQSQQEQGVGHWWMPLYSDWCLSERPKQLEIKEHCL